ncbi:hypothetical protein QNI19_26970 [Cytophagaceae bacterium DM2B3-1]|uniref:Uncharacterized protein n=1 Tax=Xanthocytophaga flava TaxID=3048013 RepID=A0ABT7CS88_9BACT|nr:hypothetical protein [Xanthocytophaga flavus]MDJ1471546.1 hypothetical protein [Xanthocytophaga flavus]MDJ1496604.1 hypothetical protein [Xanthocytophaga flavus]
MKYLLLCCLMGVGCTTSQTKDTIDLGQIDSKDTLLVQNVQGHADTVVIDKRVALFISPDTIQIEKSKKELGEENFYVGADDYMFYMSNARDFLDSMKIATLDIQGKKFVKFMYSNKSQQIVALDTLPALWSIYFFDPNKKVKDVDMTMIKEEYENYFQ